MLGICYMYCYCWSNIQTFLHIDTRWNMCKMLYKWRQENDQHMLYRLQMLYKCSTAGGFFQCDNFLCKNMKAQRTNIVHEQIWKKKITSLGDIKLTIKNQTVYFSIKISWHKIAAAITCPLEILGLLAFTQSCLYMYLSYHNQLFLKEMMNVFIYKAKT